MYRHRVWWLRRLMWWFADKLSGFGIIRNLRTLFYSTLKVTVDFPIYAENPKMHLFCADKHFPGIFPKNTKTNIKQTIKLAE